jgi:hypothetical protein
MKKQWKVETTKPRRGKPHRSKTPGDRKACNSISTAFLQSVTKIGTQNSVKSHGKALHEFPTHITQVKAEERMNISTRPNKLIRADIAVTTQGTTACSTRARELTNSHHFAYFRIVEACFQNINTGSSSSSSTCMDACFFYHLAW